MDTLGKDGDAPLAEIAASMGITLEQLLGLPPADGAGPSSAAGPSTAAGPSAVPSVAAAVGPSGGGSGAAELPSRRRQRRAVAVAAPDGGLDHVAIWTAQHADDDADGAGGAAGPSGDGPSRGMRSAQADSGDDDDDGDDHAADRAAGGQSSGVNNAGADVEEDEEDWENAEAIDDEATLEEEEALARAEGTVCYVCFACWCSAIRPELKSWFRLNEVVLSGCWSDL